MPERTKPPQQDPARAEFWDHRFRENVTPWDAGGVPAALIAFANAHRGGRRVLIPGCGRGWEAGWLAARQWDVTAIDFSTEAVALARSNLGAYAACARHADFFAFEPGEPFDVVYERTFLCALPRRLWKAYAERMAALLAVDGCLVGMFYFSEEPRGPPFGITPEALDALLAPWFERIQDRPVEDSIPLFRGSERWQVWRRARR